MQEIKLSDYKRPEFWIRSIDLELDIYEDKTISTSILKVEKNSEFPNASKFILNGIDLKIISIEINGEKFEEYNYENEVLTLNIDKNEFTLKSIVEIHPESNFTLDGFYKSGNIFCSQCEPQGFRRIAFYQDRPDVMAKFTTVLKADKKTYPILLSNGNRVDIGDLENGRHFAKWEDPFLKPAYLFAAVAGDLALVEDSFTTKSGRNVKLEIFVDPGNEDKCDHAMKSLINAMKWDEDTFGLEYDLDIYMVVAVDSFNMGAMENKGLNIFNSAYVLAKKETATDGDFQGIEGVIGHEYFHNWTGNRVTCRDWFQLTLKEGLTVFRDQEFSSDMLSRPVKRIDDVKILRSHQFSEDAGPLSHPIKPKEYIEINNFYTATVYEKGAEVIRMIHTLLGKENFRKGMDLYFKRHDGSAVTTEDFVAAMSDASGVNLEQFKVWYDQNGTPILHITTDYNEEKKEFSFSITQEAKLNNNNFDALHIPFSIGLLDSKGNELHSEKLELKKKVEQFTIKNISEKPTASWNRGFSAPVKIVADTKMEDLINLMAFDTDEFNQFNAAQDLYTMVIMDLIKSIKSNTELVIPKAFLEAYKALLTNKKLDEAFLAYALQTPSQMEINEKLPLHDYDNVKEAIGFFNKTLAETFYAEFLSLYQGLSQSEFKLDAKSMGERSLKNLCLSFLGKTEKDEVFSLAKLQYDTATNMNDEISSLSVITNSFHEKKDEFISSFYTKWKKETLVMQKWISIQAMSSKTTIDDLLALEKSDIYDAKIPNIVRSLLRSFIRGNPAKLNALDGSGYKYLVDKIIAIDKYNPSLASGLTKSLNHKNKLDAKRSSLLESELKRLLKEKLSKDTFEVASKNLT